MSAMDLEMANKMSEILLFNELFTPVVIYLIRIHGEAYFKTCTSLLDLSKK